ncbi:putative protein TPRXL, partial [Ophiophagus hannah]
MHPVQTGSPEPVVKKKGDDQLRGGGKSSTDWCCRSLLAKHAHQAVPTKPVVKPFESHPPHPFALLSFWDKKRNVFKEKNKKKSSCPWKKKKHLWDKPELEALRSCTDTRNRESGKPPQAGSKDSVFRESGIRLCPSVEGQRSSSFKGIQRKRGQQCRSAKATDNESDSKLPAQHRLKESCILCLMKELKGWKPSILGPELLIRRLSNSPTCPALFCPQPEGFFAWSSPIEQPNKTDPPPPSSFPSSSSSSISFSSSSSSSSSFHSSSSISTTSFYSSSFCFSSSSSSSSSIFSSSFPSSSFSSISFCPISSSSSFHSSSSISTTTSFSSSSSSSSFHSSTSISTTSFYSSSFPSPLLPFLLPPSPRPPSPPSPSAPSLPPPPFTPPPPPLLLPHLHYHLLFLLLLFLLLLPPPPRHLVAGFALCRF